MNSASRQALTISFVLPGRGLHGGIRVVVSYANRLIERGHRVAIVCLRRPMPRHPGRLLRRLHNDLSTAVGLRRDHLHDFKGTVSIVHPGELARVVPNSDAVVATHWLTADLVAELGASKGRGYYLLQGYEVHSFDPSLVEATWRLPLRKIVVSKWLADLATTRFGDETAALIPNGVDTDRFHAPPRQPQVPPVVGVVYSPNPVKGFAMAVEAIELARRELPALRVVCFGAWKPERSVPLPQNTRFHLRPRQGRIREIYASSDLWLCPSTTEGFGLPALEAMACRCPVVSTRCGGPLDFVEDGRNGYLVDVGDAEGMADRIVRIASDEEMWKRMSAAAYATRLRFNWDRSVSLLEEVLGGRNTGRGGR